MKSFQFKILIFSASFFLLGNSIVAQQSCVEINQTNDILLNLQTGMSVEEVNAKFNKKLKIKTKSFDDYRFFQNFFKKKPPKNLQGVKAIFLRFFEKKLYQAEIFYEESLYPSDIKSFSEIVSGKFALPFEIEKFAYNQASYKCAEKSLKIDYLVNPRIELTDENVLTKVIELKNQEAEKLKSTPK